jgi:hypothetical protein
MEAPIRLSQVALALALFSSLVAALPPAVQARTTPSTPAAPATQIIIPSLAPINSGAESSSATPTRTATDVSFLFSQPPDIVQVPPPLPSAVLELRSDAASPATDPEVTITTFALPSGFTDVLEFQEKWYLTTFWSCVTDDVQTHCGWHEPVLPGGDDSVAGAMPEARPRLVVAGAGAVVAALGWGGWGGWLF